MNEEIKQNFLRLFFSKDEVNRELAISLKQFIPKEEFINAIVNKYFEGLSEHCIVTKRYLKLITKFASTFRNFLNRVDLYEEPLFTNTYKLFNKDNPKLLLYYKITNRWFGTIMHLKMKNGINIGKIPFPCCTINIYDCINMLKNE